MCLKLLKSRRVVMKATKQEHAHYVT
jgi:hypothetical protein